MNRLRARYCLELYQDALAAVKSLDREASQASSLCDISVYKRQGCQYLNRLLKNSCKKTVSSILVIAQGEEIRRNG
jgi:hypothetical protein